MKKYTMTILPAFFMMFSCKDAIVDTGPAGGPGGTNTVRAEIAAYAGGAAELQDEVRLYDPAGALDGKEDGLYFYRKIISQSPSYLEDGGYLIFEIGHDQACDVTGMMRAQGFSDVSVKKDLAGLDRVVYGRYIR